jgi:hypothetical protein
MSLSLMENKTYTIIPNLSTNSNTITTIVTTTTASNSFVLPPSINTTTTTPSLQTLQPVSTAQSVDVYPDNNNRSNRIITQPIFSKLLSETVKQEQFEDNPVQGKYSITKIKPPTNQSKQTSGITSIFRNPHEPINGLSAIPMSMANIGGHLMSTLNASHLPNGTGQYFVSGLQNDLTSNYKIPVSSNSDLPSPSTSSNSSNPSSSHHHHQQGKRHGETGDPTRKREVRLQKNRDAARECRRKKQ